MLDDMLELGCFILLAGVFVCVLASPFVGAALWMASTSCASQAHKMELEYSWGPLQDCMVKVDDKWMLLSSYQNTIKIR